MRPASSSRALRRGAWLALAAGVAAAGLAGTPASADDTETDALWITEPLERLITPAPSDGPARSVDVPVKLSHDNDHFTVTDGRLTVDISGLAGVAEVTWPEECTPSGTTAVCAVPEVGLTDDPSLVTLRVRAVAGAVEGAEGRITYEAEAMGGPEGRLAAPRNSFDTYFRVVTGPNPVLSLPDLAPGFQAGDAVTVPFSVTNEGDRPVQGVAFSMSSTYGADFATRYPQWCTHRPASEDQPLPTSYLDCVFDTVLEPGDTFELPEPLRMATASFASTERVEIGVRPADGATDPGPNDNTGRVYIGTTNTADMSVHGTEVTAAAGETVTATIRYRNNGPAWADLLSNYVAAKVRFTAPEGTTITAAPDGCRAAGPQDAPYYECALPRWVGPDAKRAYTFELRVDRVVPDATGAVQFVAPFVTTTFPADAKPNNNHSEVVVNPSGGSGLS